MLALFPFVGVLFRGISIESTKVLELGPAEVISFCPMISDSSQLGGFWEHH
jgi:hypothetical protein